MKNKVYLAISAILTGIVTAVMFLLWPVKNDMFWIIYGFSVIAVWAAGANAACMQAENKSFAANLMPVTVSVVYLVVSAAWSVLSAAVLAAGAALCLAGHLVLLGIFLILWLLARMAAAYINSQDT